MREDLFRSTLEPVEKVLRDSKIDKANVHEIVLVGGSTRIPQIVKLVSWMSLGDSGYAQIYSQVYGAAVMETENGKGKRQDVGENEQSVKNRVREQQFSALIEW